MYHLLYRGKLTGKMQSGFLATVKKGTGYDLEVLFMLDLQLVAEAEWHVAREENHTEKVTSGTEDFMNHNIACFK